MNLQCDCHNHLANLNLKDRLYFRDCAQKTKDYLAEGMSPILKLRILCIRLLSSLYYKTGSIRCLGLHFSDYRGRPIIIWTRLNIKIGKVQKVYEWRSWYFAKMIVPSGNHFGKRTASSLIYFLNYAYFDI